MKKYLKNAKVYVDERTFAEAVVIDKNKIVFVGTQDEAQSFVDDVTQVIDCNNNLVLPGFNDSHLHLLKTAQFTHTINLSMCTSKQQVIDTASDYLHKHPHHSGLLIGYGWNQNNFVDEQSMLDCHLLDQISNEFPIVFYRACNHAVALNSYALNQLDLDKSTNDSKTIGKDNQGNYNGLLFEEAIKHVDALKQAITLEKAKQLIQEISQSANKLGITSVSTNDIRIGEEDAYIIHQAYQEIAKENPTLRVYHQVCFDSVSSFKESIESGLFNNQQEFNRFGSLKLFADGSLGARTALLSQAYRDDPSTQGIAIYTQQQLDEYIEMANKLNVQVVVHAIGDQALEMVISSYKKFNDPLNTLRHGVIHVQIAREKQLDDMARYHLLGYVQPIFLHADLHVVNQRVSDDLAKYSYAFKTMDDKKIPTSYSTDAPIEPMNVFNNLHCAINRQDLTSYPENGFQPHEKVSLSNAIKHVTIDSAYSSFNENKVGLLKAEYLADIIIVDQDLFTVDSSKIMNTKILCTIMNGNIVYSDSSFDL